MKGAPASYPILPEHRGLQKYLVFADEIQKQVDDFITNNFPGQKYIGIHLRNGQDWVRLYIYLKWVQFVISKI